MVKVFSVGEITLHVAPPWRVPVEMRSGVERGVTQWRRTTKERCSDGGPVALPVASAQPRSARVTIGGAMGGDLLATSH